MTHLKQGDKHYDVTKNEHYNAGVRDERNRWLNQPHNEHDAEIRKNERKKWKQKKLRQLRTLKFPAPFLNGLSEPFYQFLVEFIKK